MKSDQRLSYLLTIDQITGTTVGISPGMVEAGEIKGDETKTYIMDIPEYHESVSHIFNVRLHLISGDADL